MKGSFKRLSALMLCLVMVLVGCSSGATSSSVAPASSTAPASSGAASEAPAEDVKISEKERVVSVMMSDSPSQPVQNYALAQQAIFEETNIKLDYQIVPASNYGEKKAALLATNNIPEITFVNAQDLTQYATTGVFLNLTNYIDTMPNFKGFWDSIPDMKKASVGGDLFAFQMVARNETANGFGPVIRTDLLEKHNLPIPTTFDELLDVLEALKKEYPESRPYALRNGNRMQHLRTSAFMLGSGYDSQANPIYFDPDVDGGRYVFGPATQEFKTVLQFFADAYARGILDPDYATATAEQFQSRLTSGESFFFNDNSGFSIDYTNNLQKVIPEGTLEFIPYLTNSYGQRRAMAYATTLNDRFYALRADVKDPDTLIAFMDWMYSPRGSDISNYGMEGTSFEYNAEGKPEFMQSYVDKFLDQSPVYYALFSEAGITKLNFCLHAGNTEQSFEIQKKSGVWNDFADKYWAAAADENDPATGALIQPVTAPSLSEEDAERSKTILLELTTYLEQEYDKYIMGRESIDNWDKVIDRAIELGAKELEDIYNNANAAYN